MTWSRTIAGLLALPGGLLLTFVLSRGAVDLLAASSSRGGDAAAAVTGLAACAAAPIAGWLTLCLLLTVTAQLPGAAGRAARALRDRVTPVVVQRWAAVVLGASVGATVVPGTAVAAVRVADAPERSAVTPPGWLPAQPTTAPAPGWLPGHEHTVTTGSSATPGPGWLPRRPPARDRTDPHLLTGPQRSGEEEPAVVVRRGDTLWSIAAAHLGPAATEVEIARAWPRWHSANRAAIGEDPHLLLPGTRLRPPQTS